MARFSESQAPRSISLQRSLQKGRKGEFDQSISRQQVGRDAQQLRRVVAIEGDVESASLGDLFTGAAVLACQPQELRHRIAQGRSKPSRSLKVWVRTSSGCDSQK
jgi:hypothetical protein